MPHLSHHKLRLLINEKSTALLLGLLFFGYAFYRYGLDSFFSILVITTLKLLAFSMFILLPGYSIARLINPSIFNQSRAILLSVSFSIIYYVFFYTILQLLDSPAIYYLVILILGYVIIAFSCYKWLGREYFYHSKLSTDEKYGLAIVFLATVIAVCYSAVPANSTDAVGVLHNWDFAKRGLSNLSVDNRLQFDVTRILAQDLPLESFFFYDPYWSFQDRPILVGVLNAFLSLVLQIPRDFSNWHFHLFNTLLNTLFLYPLILLLRLLFKDRRIVYLIPIAVFLNIFIFHNIYYTWPKLFAVYFGLISLLILWNEKPSWLNLFIAGGLWGLGANCHTGLALSLPVFTLFLLGFLFKKKKPQMIMMFVFSFVLFMSPWTIFKKLYAPDFHNLFKAHYFKQCHKENQLIKECVIPFLKEGPDKEFFERRISNTKKYFAVHNIESFFKSLVSGNWKKYHSNLFQREWKYPLVALGTGQILLSFIIIILFFLFKILKGVSPHTLYPTSLITLSLFIIISYGLNVFAKWQLTVLIGLPYFEIVLAVAILTGISFSFHRYLTIISIGLICIRFAYLIIKTSTYRQFEIFSFFNIATVVGIIALFAIYTKAKKS